MDQLWKRTYNALTQLRREIAEGKPETGTKYMSATKRAELCTAIDRVRQDQACTLRLGRLLEKHSQEL